MQDIQNQVFPKVLLHGKGRCISLQFSLHKIGIEDNWGRLGKGLEILHIKQLLINNLQDQSNRYQP